MGNTTENLNSLVENLKEQVDKLNYQIENLMFSNYKLTSKIDELILRDEKKTSIGESLISNDDKLNSIPENLFTREAFQEAILENLINGGLDKKRQLQQKKIPRMASYIAEKEKVSYDEMKSAFGLSGAQLARDLQILFASGIVKRVRESMVNVLTLTQNGFDLKKKLSENSA